MRIEVPGCSNFILCHVLIRITNARFIDVLSDESKMSS